MFVHITVSISFGKSLQRVYYNIVIMFTILYCINK